MSSPLSHTQFQSNDKGHIESGSGERRRIADGEHGGVDSCISGSGVHGEVDPQERRTHG